MRKINVKAKSKSYNIYIGKDSFAHLQKLVRKSGRKIFIVCDKNVHHLHKSKVNSLLKTDNNPVLYRFNSLEVNKNLENVELIYSSLLKNNFSRNDLMIAVGGGIVGDVTGFAASTYMRGIGYYQVPTTLLSMVDSSVGGKTGVNFRNYKNLIGAFYQPEAVFIDLQFLSTLPEKEIISGAGEIFKYAFLSDSKSFDFIRDSLEKIISRNVYDENLILHCLKIKSAVVQSDEKETSGMRKILNIGHTFAHAFESVLNYKIKHGEAVICGIFSSLIVSEKLGLIDREELNRYKENFKFLPISKKILKVNFSDLIRLMKSDKKTSGGKIKLVLVHKPGEIMIDVEVGEKTIISALKDMNEYIRTV